MRDTNYLNETNEFVLQRQILIKNCNIQQNKIMKSR